MRLSLASKAILAAALVAASVPAFSQVAPAAVRSGLPLAVGGGYSTWDVDWGKGRMGGGTLWIDYRPSFSSPLLHGFGLEVEARDVSLGGSQSQPNMRQDTAGGGVTYTWLHYRDFHPYGKFLASQGSMDFNIGAVPPYEHDTRALFQSGGGFEYRAFGHIWARGDYEYQFWQILLGKRPDPQGLTFGVMYDFRPVHGR